jgi:hypothetical protein
MNRHINVWLATIPEAKGNPRIFPFDLGNRLLLHLPRRVGRP